MNKQVFISFAWEDRGLVNEALKELRKKNVLVPETLSNLEDVFEKNETAYIRNQIKNRISNSNTFVVIWSKQAADSPWVQYELGMAQALNIPTIVALTESKAPQLPAGLKDIQVVRLDSTQPIVHPNKPAKDIPEHLAILRQGVDVWNDWRESNPYLRPDLSGADLQGMDTRGAYLAEMDLRRVDLSGRDLSGAQLFDTDFTESKLNGANLTRADLRRSNLFRADLIKANMEGAELQGTDFRQAYLMGANLKGIYMGGANFTAAALGQADFTGSTLNGTVFGENYLDDVIGLDSVIHNGPSVIGIETISLSGGRIPKVFLSGCGLNDWQIASAKLHQPELTNEEINNTLYRIHDLRVHQIIQISPLFISYSHADTAFVDKMETYLNEKGIRFWRDVHHATAGRLETQIDRAIRLNPTVLLVLSEHSVESDWVQHEARLARKLEVETKHDVLCPVALDDSWKACRWPERLREQIMEYNILDFSEWKDEDKFRRMFSRLLDGLDLFYK